MRNKITNGGVATEANGSKGATKNDDTLQFTVHEGQYTIYQCKRILRASMLEDSNTNAYVLHLALNTWQEICNTIAPNSARYLYLRLTKLDCNLTGLLAQLQSDADAVVHSQFGALTKFGEQLAIEIGCMPDTSGRTPNSGRIKNYLIFCRFIKRLSLPDCSALAESSIDSFVRCEAWNKRRSRCEDPYWLVTACKAALKPILSRYIVPGKYSKDRYFSHGTCQNCSQNLSAKVTAALADNPNVFGWTSSIPGIFNKYQTISGIVPVPKNYKACRVIATESAYRQFQLQARREAFVQAISKAGLSRSIPIEEQEINQCLAEFGTFRGEVATIDLSAASDTVRRSLVNALFSDYPYILEDIEKYLPTHWILPNGKMGLMHMYSTSGNATTFVVESLVFYSIAMAAVKYNTLFGKDVDTTLIAIMGDDMIVPTNIVDTVIEFLELLGFTVNHEKTFSTFDEQWCYRESCGKEFLNGDDVTMKYFTRNAWRQGRIEFKDWLAQCAIDLQHKYFDWPSVSAWLTEYVFTLYPKMTFSLEGDDCDDLWTTYPDLIRTVVISQSPMVLREKHYVLSTNYRKHNSKVTTTPEYNIPDVRITEDLLVRMLDEFIYHQYLELGPSYDSELDALLGTSTSRRYPNGQDSLHLGGVQEYKIRVK